MTKSYVLPIIVFAQFCCTSLWFAGNAVMGDLSSAFGLDEHSLGDLTSFVQFGFIVGTLVFALLSIADRYSPSKVFFVSAFFGALFNIGTVLEMNTFSTLLMFRFLVGFSLAGIYPVGMKIAADHFEKGLGKSLGFLVGALVLGTAFPHLLKGVTSDLPWRAVLLITSAIALIGGVMIFGFISNGSYRNKSQKIHLKSVINIFRKPAFRSAAFGYFGHMWELYAFWAFVPIMLEVYNETHGVELDISFWSFSIIGLGSLGCVMGGYLSQKYGVKKVAFLALLFSFIACLISPLMFGLSSPSFFLIFMIFWGLVVIADSPLFSTLVAQNAPTELKGTALTIVNSLGFLTTIVSIQLVGYLKEIITPTSLYVCLAIGPFLGLLALIKKGRA